MNIVDALSGEHAALLTLFEYLERVSTQLDLNGLHDAGYLLEAMIQHHSMMEDQHLFDALPPAQGGVKETLEAMRSEHRAIAKQLGELRSEQMPVKARGCLLRAMEMTREHFAVEERVLFSICGKMLGERQLADLGRCWARKRLRRDIEF